MNNNKNLAYFSILIFLFLNSYFLFTVDVESRIINDGYILKSELCMMVAKSSLQNKKLQRLAKLLSTKY